MDDLFAAVSPGGSLIADEVVLMPVENAVESRLSPERAATLRHEDIEAMNDHLELRLKSSWSSTMRPALAIPKVFNEMIEGLDDETQDGLHFSEAISKVQASVLLNLRCNDVLPKKFPFAKTCCSQYPTPNWIQLLLLFLFLAWGPAGLYFHSKGAFQGLGRLNDRADLVLPSRHSLRHPRLLPRAKVPPPPLHLRIRRLLPLCRRPDVPLPQGEQAVRRPHLWRPLHRLARGRRRDPQARREGPRIPQPRADGRVEGVDADRDSHLPLPRRVQDQRYLQPDSGPRRGVPLHERVRSPQLLPQEGRLWILARRQHPRSDQPPHRRPLLPHEHRLPLVLLFAPCHHVYVRLARPRCEQN